MCIEIILQCICVDNLCSSQWRYSEPLHGSLSVTTFKFSCDQCLKKLVSHKHSITTTNTT